MNKPRVSGLDPAHLTLAAALQEVARKPLKAGAAFKLDFAASQIYKPETQIGQKIPGGHDVLEKAFIELREALKRRRKLSTRLNTRVNAVLTHIRNQKDAHPPAKAPTEGALAGGGTFDPQQPIQPSSGIDPALDPDAAKRLGVDQYELAAEHVKQPSVAPGHDFNVFDPANGANTYRNLGLRRIND